jgi:glycosyltransferase involved in cell wall biosynthesis
MTTPDVSVLVPSFNHGRFIEEAVASALSSAVARTEVVIVDDGSTDDTRERIRKFSSDERVRIIEQENQGAHAALNRALENARGEFLFILDSDDAFPPGRIPRLVEELESNPGAAVAASWIEIIDENGHAVGVKEGWRNLPPWPPPTDGPRLSDLEDPVLALLETNYVSTTSNFVFRRSLVKAHGLRFQNLRYTHDWDFLLSACHHGVLRLVPEPLLKYRVHSDNTIKEGAGSEVGRMRFEILWVVARHAYRTLRSRAGNDLSFDSLLERAWASMPTFGCEGVLDRLLLLRGQSEEPPVAYDAIARPAHPLHQSSAAVLARQA